MILPLYDGLHVQDHEMRINTVELLDNILDPPLKKAVISIVECATLDHLSIDDLNRLDLSVPNEQSCFEAILRGDDTQLKLAVLHLIEAMADPDYNELILIAAQDEHIRVQNYAEKILPGPPAL